MTLTGTSGWKLLSYRDHLYGLPVQLPVWRPDSDLVGSGTRPFEVCAPICPCDSA